MLLVPLAAGALNRGPSTPEERQRALEYIRHFEADPLNPDLRNEREWVIRWTIEIPDVRINLCPNLVKLPKGERKDSVTLFTAMTFAETAFTLQHPDKQDDLPAQYQAGVEGVLRIYEILVKANSKDRESFLDELIRKREAGTLAQFVQERAPGACKSGN
jgi:hypothetical protein